MTVRKHIDPYMGHLWIDNLTSSHVEQWLEHISHKTGTRTQENAYVVLRTALNHYAQRSGCKSPCDTVSKTRHEPEEINPFTTSEVKRILKAVDGNRLAGVYELALRTGMRQGELFGLHWKDVDLKRGELRVVVQAVEHAGRVTLAPPKTRYSRRTIQLDKSCLDALVARKAHAMREPNSNLVFPNTDGSIFHRSNFGHRHWTPLLKRLKISHRGFHHCRHTAATLMLYGGIPLQQVSSTLGHSRPSVTLDIYSHVMPETTLAAQAVSDLIERSG